ncbi:methyltransferase [Methylomonas sp. SURF-2]|uniref:Ribosomal RNA large subunit methyltransferase G n=1 Tax=Methylomonas subterranea TaxID=2952225 RepID=A0ABT1TDQ9_9GAMM|nr:methyltransferase [Methylomonas sp. SURF-2]MCQ8103560.1 methyltransferase [Methylomonas sp. SURF-2]
MQTDFEFPQGRLRLRRLPYRKNDLLRAWDAADSYLLEHLAAADAPEPAAHIVIVNDSFGALTLALHRYRPTAISDSFLSRQATLNNAELNRLDLAGLMLLDSLSLPDRPIDYLLIKAPKTLGLLEYQLHMLRPLLTPATKIIVAGMVKALSANVWKCLEALIGPTRTSLAVKKARLIFADLDRRLRIPANPYPRQYRLDVDVNGVNYDFPLDNHANVFSRDSLDIGTRFLLQHLPDNPAHRDFIDLGCGNGVVGLMIAQRLPEARIRFVDESYMAVASAKDNFMRAFAGQRQAEFLVGDGLTGFAENSADCIVCNPPFHQQHAVGDHIAWQMFDQARRVLRGGGELRVIGNRHLNYHSHLKKLFGHWEAVAANAKFTIIKTSKR